MRTTELKGKVQTVLGPIEPDAVGITLPHEHLIDDGTTWVHIPDAIRDMVTQPITLDTLCWVRYHPFHNLDDRRLLDEDEAIEEALRFKQHGGATIVEVTSVGLGRDPRALTRISQATGLNVVMGCGYYIGAAHPADMDAKTEEEIAGEIVSDIIDGVDDSGVCAGIIGEIGMSWPPTENEVKSLAPP
jgi:phosphotriesterase-related protein